MIIENTVLNGNENGPENVEAAEPTPAAEAGLPGVGGHLGKIDRLPLAIREELHQRLHNGQPGKQLVEWLNGLPEVQAVMAAQFNGQPVLEPNLTRFKQSRHPGWLATQRALAAMTELFEHSTCLQAAANGALTDRMGLVIAAKMTLELQRLDSLPDGEQKAKSWRELLAGLAQLRRGDLQGERVRVEREKLGFRRELHEKEQEAAFFQWAEKPANRSKILERLLTPEENHEELWRRNEAKRRRAKEILGIAIPPPV